MFRQWGESTLHTIFLTDWMNRDFFESKQIEQESAVALYDVNARHHQAANTGSIRRSLPTKPLELRPEPLRSAVDQYSAHRTSFGGAIRIASSFSSQCPRPGLCPAQRASEAQSRVSLVAFRRPEKIRPFVNARDSRHCTRGAVSKLLFANSRSRQGRRCRP